MKHQHRIVNDLKGTNEFLSGITKEDKIKPVITVVLYYGEKPWDGPLQLSDMMDIPMIFRPFFNEHKTYIIQVRNAASNIKFENTDNQDFFTMINEFYENGGRMNFESFKNKYPEPMLWKREVR